MTSTIGASNGSAVVILGAGFSRAAGLPLTRELFETEALPLYVSKRAAARLREAQAAWTRWKADHTPDAEVWLTELYRAGASAASTYGTTWESALQFVLSRLILTTKRAKKVHFFYGVTTPNLNPAHQRFWTEVRAAFDVRAVVTMNYDLLAEQALKEIADKKRRPPVCYYGGQPMPQFVLKVVKLTARNQSEKVEPVMLGTQLPIFKMHGSMNWAFEHGDFKIHDDVRAAFRTDPTRGDVAIVPPVQEKERPQWLYLVWQMAAERLKQSPNWLVCGYSLPEYDKSLTDFFAETAASNPPKRVYVLDPHADSVAARWRAILPAPTEVLERPGIPEVFDTDWL